MPKDFSIYGDILNHPCSLVMSGVESDAYWDIAIGEGIDRLLVSYHYIQRKGKGFIKNRLAKHPHVKLMIDSGAHTFHAKEEEYKNKPIEFWEDYLERYTRFIRANKDHIFSCVELDIGNLVGFEKVDYFRERYFEPLKKEGILVCYVWHTYDGVKYWETMCQKYDYVGFSLMNSTLSETDIIKMMNVARRYGAVVHGFAITRVELMSKVPFFTGDSTTWLVGTQYGELNWFDGRKMKRLKKDKWKTVYKPKYVKLGANPKMMDEENPYELIRINLIVFRQAEEYIRKRIRAKQYWIRKIVEEVKKVPKLVRRKKTDGSSSESAKKEEVKEDIGVPVKSNSSVPSVPNRPEPSTGTTRGGEAIPEERPKTKYEEYIAQSQKPEKVIPDLDEQIAKLPPIEWFDGDCEDYKDVYRDLGIDLEGMHKDDILDILYNFCLFLRDDELLEEQEDEVLFNMVKFVTQKSTDSREQAISDLVDFYSKNLTGERSDFLSESGDDMEAPPRPLERESYLEDEEYEMVDVPEQEMQNFLPAPKEGNEMPEVDEIDKELSNVGIVAVRDEKGRFLKGQKKVRKPKTLASQHFPKLACNTCYKAGECPEYKPDHACAYEKVFKKFKTRNMDDLMDAMFSMADLNMERMSRLALFETMDGGMPDPTLTTMIDQNLNIMMKMKQLHDMKAQIVATQRRTLTSDGTVETTTTVQNPTGGILSQIFGMGGGSSSEDMEEEDNPKRKIIDAES